MRRRHDCLHTGGLVFTAGCGIIVVVWTLFQAQCSTSAKMLAFAKMGSSMQRQAGSAAAGPIADASVHVVASTAVVVPATEHSSNGEGNNSVAANYYGKDLLRESCPGPPGTEPAGARYIFRKQNPRKCETAKFMVSFAGGLFGCGNAGLGFGAEMGPALALLSNALSTGYIYAYNTLANKNFFNRSSIFQPLSKCNTPDSAEVSRVPEVDCNEFHGGRIMRCRRFWGTASKQALRNPNLPGFGIEQGHFQAAAYLFFLRLTDRARAVVEDALRASLPKDFRPDRAIAMPIRGSSDKCGHESQCLSFEQYMQLAEAIRNYDPNVRDIIFTSDNATMTDSARRFDNSTSRWRFIFNARDAEGRQGWRGTFSTLETQTLISITSLHLQLRGKYYILNGNSHWHQLIGRLVSEGGCQFVTDPMVVWLDQQDNKFRLCGIMNQQAWRCFGWRNRTNNRNRTRMASAEVPAAALPWS
mmetsp:Transcript_29999/g.82308  ORF Transcript_29999/g.82308 Transcript_29999/m.82308 type:complete len:472 (+) Transcript_29999:56-1471(+)